MVEAVLSYLEEKSAFHQLDSASKLAENRESAEFSETMVQSFRKQ